MLQISSFQATFLWFYSHICNIITVFLQDQSWPLPANNRIPRLYIHGAEATVRGSGTGISVVWGFQSDSERLNGLIRPFIRLVHGNRTVGQIH